MRQGALSTLAFYIVLGGLIISALGTAAIAEASAIGHAVWLTNSNTVCTGSVIRGNNWINYIPLSIYGLGDYRAELNTDMTAKPTITSGNIPNIGRGWQIKPSKLFSSGMTVWAFDSGLFVTSISTKWMVFKTYSDYPLTLVQAVEDVSGWHVPHTKGTATIYYVNCGGGPEGVQNPQH